MSGWRRKGSSSSSINLRKQFEARDDAFDYLHIWVVI